MYFRWNIIKNHWVWLAWLKNYAFLILSLWIQNVFLSRENTGGRVKQLWAFRQNVACAVHCNDWIVSDLERWYSLYLNWQMYSLIRKNFSFTKSIVDCSEYMYCIVTYMTMKQFTFGPILVNPKCVWQAYIYFDFSTKINVCISNTFWLYQP